MPLKNWSSFQARWLKSSLKRSIGFCGILSKFKQNFIAYRSSPRWDCILEIHQLWLSGFSRVYSNCCCSCSSEPEIIKKIGQLSHKIYSNNILSFQESATILHACIKKVWKLIESTTYINIYIYITNLLSTSIHGYKKKRKKTPEIRDKNISNHHPWEKEKKS